MANVIPFPATPPEPEGQWNSGAAQCLLCGHEWVAVAPTGVVWLECPSCRAVKGHFKFHCCPGEDEPVWACDCGNALFFLTPNGHMCANCGTFQRYG
jgi:hypothetical protein